jgi:hypothetical protein
MAEQKRRTQPERKRGQDIAAADWLLDDESATKQPGGSGNPGRSTGWSEDDVFELVGGSSVEPAATPESGTAQATAGPPSEWTRLEPGSPVEEVWTRWGEWGPNLVVVGVWLLAVAIFAYITLVSELYALSFLSLILGGAVAVLLSYPIIITLERPVRVTPEQALRDFYGALAHHLPHYRRMWLLLAATGRTTAHYGSLEGFKAYWAGQLRELKSGRAPAMTPLVFEIADYRGEKSAGQARIVAQFSLKISVRGQRQAGPIVTIPAEISLVRGPDKMWYLENGTLPEPVPAPAPSGPA